MDGRTDSGLNTLIFSRLEIWHQIDTKLSRLTLIAKERAWNNLNNNDTGFLFLTKRSQEAHSCSTQRLRSFSQEQKDQSECSSYFMHVPKSGKLAVQTSDHFLSCMQRNISRLIFHLQSV
jgi:hypothetical protein